MVSEHRLTAVIPYLFGMAWPVVSEHRLTLLDADMCSAKPSPWFQSIGLQGSMRVYLA